MKYVCQICGYVYDDAAEKVPFASLPEDWRCPLCGAAKSDFRPMEEKPAEPKKPAAPIETLHKLSVGELSAVCSNLGRGCEKQYKAKEAELFRRLADYFADVTPAVEDASTEEIAKRLADDIANYPALREVGVENQDRGAQRVTVWGEKVTRMLSSLVHRYLEEGEAMLADTEIWVCTVCGFVYIGENPPELCPVCKVPSWKFEKIGGKNA